jgi:hypothetical protein
MPQNRFSIYKILDLLKRGKGQSGDDTKFADDEHIEIQLDDAKRQVEAKPQSLADNNNAQVPQDPPAAPNADETTPPSVRNRTIWLYVGLALAILVPGLHRRLRRAAAAHA